MLLHVADLEHADALPPSSSRRRGRISEFVRYLVVGGIAFVVDTGLYWVLLHAGLDPLAANPLAFSAGLCCNYVLAARFVFSTHRFANRKLEFVLYAAIGVVGLGLNQLLLYLGLRLIQAPMEAKIAATAGVMLFNFGARKLMLFSTSAADA